MDGMLKQYKLKGLITLNIETDYFHDELPRSDALEDMLLSFLEDYLKDSKDFKILSSKTLNIEIEDMTR